MRYHILANLKQQLFYNYCLLLVLLYTWEFAPCAFAQNVEKKVTLNIGYSYSSQNPTLFNLGNIKSPKFAINTIYYSLQYEQPLSNNYGIVAGVQFSEKGFKSFNFFTGPNIDVKIDYQYRLNYIELPIFCQRYFFTRPPKKSSYWLIKAGIIGSYLLEANYRLEQLDYYKSSFPPNNYGYYNFSNTVTNRFNRWDVGILIGINKRLNKHFDLSFTMQKHFIETNKAGFDEMRQNQQFMLGIGYHIF